MSTLSQIGFSEWKFMSLIEHKLPLCFHELFLTQIIGHVVHGY